MQVRVFSSLLMAGVVCSVLFAGSVVRADDASTLREAQAALDKADYDQAVRILKPLVDSGNAEALYVMGRLILDGKGVKKNFENAVANCKNDIIFLCDQDDVWCPDKVERVLREFSENKEILLTMHDAEVVDSDLNVIEKSFFAIRNTATGYIKNIIK